MFFKKNKIFCIGFNKTGTTSLERALKEFGFKMGNQAEAESMFDDWVKRDFKKLYAYCKKSDAFQDAPFSFPFTFTAMDQFFPNSKFILTERDSPDQWYNSITRFHGKLWANDSIPTKADLLQANYIYKGFPYHNIKKLFNTDDNDLYNKEILMRTYVDHNNSVKNYFKYRPNDLLVLNLKDADSYKKLCSFIEKKELRASFPWENKTENM